MSGFLIGPCGVAPAAVGGTSGTTWDNLNISNGSLDVTKLIFTNNGAVTDGGVQATVSKTTGKLYFEGHWSTGSGSSDSGIGITNAVSTFAQLANNALDGMLLFASGNLWRNGALLRTAATGAFTAGGTTVGIAIDIAATTMWVTIDGINWSGTTTTAQVASGTGGDIINFSGPYFPAVTGTASGSDIWTANFGGSGFTFSAAAATLVAAGYTAGWA